LLPQKKVSGFFMEHVVLEKHAWPTGHSVEERLEQGTAQLVEASSKLKPQKYESSGTKDSTAGYDGIPSAHVVYL